MIFAWLGPCVLGHNYLPIRVCDPWHTWDYRLARDRWLMVVNVSSVDIHTLCNRARTNLARLSQRSLNWRKLTETRYRNRRRHSGASLPTLVGRLRSDCGGSGGDYRLSRLHRLNASRNNRSRRLLLILLQCLLMPLFERLHLLLFLMTSVNRLSYRATYRTANVLAAVIMAENIP